MISRYQIVTTVSFRHSYFSDARYTGFSVEPDKATQHTMKRFSLICKVFPDGFSLFYETGPFLQRNRAAVLKESACLRFRIINNDPDFFSYTEGLPENIAESLFFASDKNVLRTDPANDLAILGNQFFNVEDILQAKIPGLPVFEAEAFFRKPFGFIEINFHPQLPAQFALQFKEKETVWRYILSSDHLQDLTQPAVIHKDTKEAFAGPVWLLLPDGKKRMAFESQKPIPLRNKPEKVFQLVENFEPVSGKCKVVLGVLPNPNIKHFSFIDTEKKQGDGKENNFSEIFI
ncbi:MAG: hypothetical protein V4450_09955 [Bacteroidota bacterium]